MLGLKPARSAPPRSIIVRFLDYTVKEVVLWQAWAQRQVKFQGEVIYFVQDYSPEVQRKRAWVRGVIKQLKVKGIQAKCRFQLPELMSSRMIRHSVHDSALGIVHLLRDGAFTDYSTQSFAGDAALL